MFARADHRPLSYAGAAPADRLRAAYRGAWGRAVEPALAACAY